MDDEHGVVGMKLGAKIDGTFRTVVVPSPPVWNVIACDGDACTPT
jgi:hypothetical protein